MKPLPSDAQVEQATMQRLQEQDYGPGRDYHAASPHLKHAHLTAWLVDLVLNEVKATGRAGLPPRALEVGAGHGGFTEPTLAFGCSVTATEMSRPSLEHLRSRYSLNPRFEAVFDPDGSLSVLGDARFSFVLCASVLHHIPDYLAFLQGPVLDRMHKGGSLVTFQDPLWYPGLSAADRAFSRTAYYSWRLTQGQFREGLKTRLRRLRGIRDVENPRDMVEYHVIRQGVNQDRILAALTPRFESVVVLPYWSTQGSGWQQAGERLGCTNTFAIVARSFRD